MSGVDDLSLEPVYLSTTDQGDVPLSTHNYATLGLTVAGTFTTGNFVVEGTMDGVEWVELPVAIGNNQLPQNEITAVGTYIVGVAGYVKARIVPDTFTGNVRITPNLSKRITPAFTVGFGA